MRKLTGAATLATAIALGGGLVGSAGATPSADNCSDTIARQTGKGNTAARADTIRLGPWREVDDRRAGRNHDADGSHSNTPGDFFTGRIYLVKGRRRMGTVTIKSTIVTLNGSQAHLRDEYTARLRGGHLSGVYEHDEDFNAHAKVGDVDHLPITRGDGRFAGYTGEVLSRVVKVAGSGEPTFADTIILHKGA